MRITLTPKKFELGKPQSFEQPEVYRFAFKFLAGSGTILIVKTDIIDHVYESENNVVVEYEDNDTEIVHGYEITSIDEL